MDMTNSYVNSIDMTEASVSPALYSHPSKSAPGGARCLKSIHDFLTHNFSRKGTRELTGQKIVIATPVG